MLKSGDYITIRNSHQLIKRGLNCLSGKTGIVSSLMISKGQLLGAYVEVTLNGRRKKYFIPTESIEGPEFINKLRSLALLKSTIL